MIIKEDEETCGYCTTIKAEDEQIGIAAREEQERREQMKALRVFDQESIINDRLKNVSFATYEPSNRSQAEALHVMKKYVERFSKEKPVPVILMGTYGLGKSHLAAATTKALAEKNISSIFISVPKLLTKIKGTWDDDADTTENELLNALEKVDCLVLDDIGAEQTKRVQKKNQPPQVPWGVTKLFEIIDSRIGKHTVFTTNLEIPELQEHLGPRNFSRMMEGVHVMKLTGEDYRLRQFKEA